MKTFQNTNIALEDNLILTYTTSSEALEDYNYENVQT